MNRSLPAALLPLLLAACRTTGPAPRTDADPARAEAAGVRWLLDHQNPDGSWGTFADRRPHGITSAGPPTYRGYSAATTSLAALALVEPARRDPAAAAALRRATAYLLAQRIADRAHPTIFYEIWAHSYECELYATLLLAGAEAAPRADLLAALQAEADALVRIQTAGGGFAYYDFEHRLATPSDGEATSFNTAVGLHAMLLARRAGARVPDGHLEQARRMLEAMRSPEGTFVYSMPWRTRPEGEVNRWQGAAGRSCLGLLALGEADAAGLPRGQGQSDPAADRALALRMFRTSAWPYLLAAYGRPIPHEAYHANAGYFVLFGCRYATELARGVDDAEGRRFNLWVAGELARLQADDGHWLDFPLLGYGQSYGTAFAVLALQNARQNTR